MPIITDPMALEGRRGTMYPGALATGFDKRTKRMMTTALGLTQFGVNMTTLEPGAMSSLRHWHAKEDECVFILTGEVVLVTNDGETPLRAGMAAGFPAGDANGHHLVNRSEAPATFLEIGSRSENEDVTYSDADLRLIRTAGDNRMTRKTGEGY